MMTTHPAASSRRCFVTGMMMTLDFQTIVVFVGLLILSGYFSVVGEETQD